MSRAAAKSAPPKYDVVVVGGGLSGILVAQRLRDAGARVLVLEAGARPPWRLPDPWPAFVERVRPFIEVDPNLWGFRSDGRPYEWLRVRAMGGRSLLWGGWCSRPIEQSWRDAERVGAAWPVSFAEVETYRGRVERWLNVRTAPLAERTGHLRAAIGVEVGRKRCAVTPRGGRPLTALDRAGNLTVRSASVALRLVVEHGAVSGVCFTADAQVFTEPTRVVVLCASPIETARILVASSVPGPIGEGFCDHVVASCLAIQDAPVPKGAPPGPLSPAAFVPRFVNLPGGQKRDYVGGFTSEVVGPRSAVHLPEDVCATLGIRAADAHQLSFYVVHAIGELMPDRRRRVTFDKKNRDALDRSRPVFHLGRTADEVALCKDLSETVAALADAIALPGSRIVPIRDPRTISGAGHEAGTCAMAARGGVTDAWGAVRGLRGAWIADASVMPTPLDRHPTLTLLALALRTSDRVAEALRRGEA